MLRTHSLAMFCHHGMLLVVIVCTVIVCNCYVKQEWKSEKNNSVCERWVAHGCPAERCPLTMTCSFTFILLIGRCLCIEALLCVLLLFKMEGYTVSCGKAGDPFLKSESCRSRPVVTPWNGGSSLQIEFSSGFLRRAWFVVHFSEISTWTRTLSRIDLTVTLQKARCVSVIKMPDPIKRQLHSAYGYSCHWTVTSFRDRTHEGSVRHICFWLKFFLQSPRSTVAVKAIQILLLLTARFLA